TRVSPPPRRYFRVPLLSLAAYTRSVYESRGRVCDCDAGVRLRGGRGRVEAAVSAAASGKIEIDHAAGRDAVSPCEFHHGDCAVAGRGTGADDLTRRDGAAVGCENRR